MPQRGRPVPAVLEDLPHPWNRPAPWDPMGPPVPWDPADRLNLSGRTDPQGP